MIRRRRRGRIHVGFFFLLRGKGFQVGWDGGGRNGGGRIRISSTLYVRYFYFALVALLLVLSMVRAWFCYQQKQEGPWSGT